jgi:Tfp pilus assembly protein PilZ
MKNSAKRFFRRDMRTAPRHDLKENLRVRIWKSDTPDQHAESVNVSEGGLFFVTDAVLQRGEEIEVFLQMPKIVTGEAATNWRCTGQVMRVEPMNSPTGKLGIGMRFDCYEVSRSEVACSPASIFLPGRFGSEIEAAHAKTSSHR